MNSVGILYKIEFGVIHYWINALHINVVLMCISVVGILYKVE